MGIKKFKPVTPGRRFMTVSDFADITHPTPEKSLRRPLKKSGGRGNTGRVTSRHRGGGHKRNYRLIDFKRNKTGIPARVASIEYDPNRSARIALLHYLDGEKRYILAPHDLKVDDVIVAGENSEIKTGNTLPLASIPLGMSVHNLELKPGRTGGALGRDHVPVAGQGRRIRAYKNAVRRGEAFQARMQSHSGAGREYRS